MNILYLYAQMTPKDHQSQTLFAGGAQKRTYQMAAYFRSLGHNVYLASDDAETSRTISELTSCGVEHIKIPFRCGFAKQLSCFVRLAKIVRHHQIEIIHCNDRWTAMFGRIIGQLTKTPMVYSARNVFDCKKHTRFFFGNHIAAVSKGVQDNLVKYFGIKPEKIRVIHNGTDIKHSEEYVRNAVKDEFRISENDKIICAIGRLSEQKGICYLLDSLAVVLLKHPHIKLLLVGDGELKDRLKRQAIELQIQDHVIFCGNQTQVEAFIDISLFTVMPSLWEGLPGGAIESIMLGKPVIAASVGGLPEVVTDSVNGLIIPPRDSDALAAAIEFMIEDIEMVRRMSAKSIEIANESFTLSQMLGKYKVFYEDILQNSKRRKAKNDHRKGKKSC